jgi:hypothetical protein
MQAPLGQGTALVKHRKPDCEQALLLLNTSAICCSNQLLTPAAISNHEAIAPGRLVDCQHFKMSVAGGLNSATVASQL